MAALAPATQAFFAGMSPRPYRYYCRFGLSNAVINGQVLFNVHPDLRLWFRVPAGRHRITADFLMEPGAYENLPAGDATDGVALTVWEVKADGTRRVLYQRRLNPRDNPADRGLQNMAIETDIAVGSDILFVSDPGEQNNLNRDWTWLGKFTIH